MKQKIIMLLAGVTLSISGIGSAMASPIHMTLVQAVEQASTMGVQAHKVCNSLPADMTFQHKHEIFQTLFNQMMSIEKKVLQNLGLSKKENYSFEGQMVLSWYSSQQQGKPIFIQPFTY